jgi:hypothetical protein
MCSKNVIARTNPNIFGHNVMMKDTTKKDRHREGTFRSDLFKQIGYA